MQIQKNDFGAANVTHENSTAMPAENSTENVPIELQIAVFTHLRVQKKRLYFVDTIHKLTEICKF